MTSLNLQSIGPLRGRIRIPGDKSISHRALLLSSLAQGTSEINGFLPSGDCLATVSCLKTLGVKIDIHDATSLTVHGQGLYGFKAPSQSLNCVRSGTSMRLLAGILSGQPFSSTLVGEAQLSRRPMRRVIEPLRHMGALIEDTEGHAPLNIQGRPLKACEYTLSIASAQVKSAILLAGLYANGPVTIHEPGPSRDHTERVLMSMGVPIQKTGPLSVLLSASAPLCPQKFNIPGDFSSAMFPAVAATLVPDSDITLKGVCFNQTRTGLWDVLRRMGAQMFLSNQTIRSNEPVADLMVRFNSLSGIEISGEDVVRMIDEFPVFALAATQAKGKTIVRDASELRVKETDRIATVVTELKKLGAQIEAQPDGFIVHGPTPLKSAVVDSHGDHRLAMTLAIAGLLVPDGVTVENAACMNDSFPGFVKLMEKLGARINFPYFQTEGIEQEDELG